MAIDTEIVDGLFMMLALVWCPVIGLLAFGTIRHEVRLRGAWRPGVIRALTIVMWSMAIVPCVAVLLGAFRVTIAIQLASLVAFLLSARVGRIIAGPPNARAAAAGAVNRVFEEFNTKYEPEDADAIRAHLAELDDVVTTDTFEFVQLTRAYVLHALDGGSPNDPNAVRRRERLTEIAVGWWGRPATTDPARRLSRWARRHAAALALLAGMALGAGVWNGVEVPQVVASVVVAWLVWFATMTRVAAASLAGAAVGLLAAFGLEIAACTACDWTASATSVAALVVVFLLVAWYADTRDRPIAMRSLSVVPSTPGDPDGEGDPGGPRSA